MCEERQSYLQGRPLSVRRGDAAGRSSKLTLPAPMRSSLKVPGHAARRLAVLQRHTLPITRACASASSGAEEAGTDDPIVLLRRESTATVVLARPPYNALGLSTMDRLEEVVNELVADTGVRAVVITSAGLPGAPSAPSGATRASATDPATFPASFSVGMNLKQIPQGVAEKGSFAALLDQRLRVLRRIEGASKPFIAALFGHCLGGGLELALACHIRLAPREPGAASIGLPELELGAVPAWGGSARLPRVVGASLAMDMILRGRSLDGPQALAGGLVSELAPLAGLYDHAHAVAGRIAAMPPVSVAAMMRVVRDFGPGCATYDEAEAAERAAVEETMATEDAQEGMAAFAEKRKPVFKGR